MQAIPSLTPFIDYRKGNHRVEVKVKLPPLIPGVYFASVWVGSHNTETLDHISDGVSFEILESPSKGRTFPHTRDHGNIVPTSEYDYF